MKNKILSSLSALVFAVLLFLLLFFEDSASEAAKNALLISVNNVIPPLFAYMVISSVIIELDLLEPIYRHIPTDRMFRLPRCTSPVILTGLVCGFPVGAAGTKSLYDSGKISLREASLLVALSSCASPAFLIGSVGRWWGDVRFGAVLYLVSIVTIIVFGAVCGRRMKKGENITVQSVNQSEHEVGRNFASSVCGSISRTSAACLNVTAYITFFSILRAILTELIPPLSLFFAAVLEFSGGAYMGAVRSGVIGAAASGFAVGFTSLSVFMQTYNITSRSSIPLSYFTVSKLIVGFTCAVSAAIYETVLPMQPCTAIKDVGSCQYPVFRVISAMIVLSVLCVYCDKCSKNKNFSAKY
ncbi:MAG: hypothetical protein ACI4XJ_11965 [Eubacteriales bacterium]